MLFVLSLKDEFYDSVSCEILYVIVYLDFSLNLQEDLTFTDFELY